MSRSILSRSLSPALSLWILSIGTLLESKSWMKKKRPHPWDAHYQFSIKTVLSKEVRVDYTSNADLFVFHVHAHGSLHSTIWISSHMSLRNESWARWYVVWDDRQHFAHNTFIITETLLGRMRVGERQLCPPYWKTPWDFTKHRDATPTKSTKSRTSNSLVHIQSSPKFQFQFVSRDTEESEFLDLVDFGHAAFLGETVIAWSGKTIEKGAKGSKRVQILTVTTRGVHTSRYWTEEKNGRGKWDCNNVLPTR